ncbi:thiamine pyrophosphate-dependent enzyme [Streptomyces sp. NPDC059680]|uniref:thiamine pyrophosphate-dependent enzyme n=1 Tax=Streptomyces sp. NPDC059680 TaxID=3346904 RepID=UPI0036C7869F
MPVSGLPSYGTTNTNPDFAAVARACGAYGMRVEKPEQLARRTQGRLPAQGPALVDLVTDPNAGSCWTAAWGACSRRPARTAQRAAPPGGQQGMDFGHFHGV